MAAKAAKELDPLLALFLEFRIVHEGSVRVFRGIVFPERDEVAGDVFGIRFRKAQAGHHGHVLNLEFVAVVGALAVVEIKDVRESLLLVILGADVFFLYRAVGPRALARIVHPANEVIVIRLFADAREVGRERAALQLVAFTDRVARQATARFTSLIMPKRSTSGQSR